MKFKKQYQPSKHERVEHEVIKIQYMHIQVDGIIQNDSNREVDLNFTDCAMIKYLDF